MNAYSLSGRLNDGQKGAPRRTARSGAFSLQSAQGRIQVMKLFRCQHCGQILYFENQTCEKCGHRLGFIPEVTLMSALELQNNVWRALANDRLYRFCVNEQFGVCNWLIEEGDPQTYCVSCRHNSTIPDISVPANLEAWRKIEMAKHRLFYALLRLQLSLHDKDDAAKQRLTFNFLAAPPSGAGPKVMTGHDDGVITVALEEADDAEREKRRSSMHEPYRTLLGHFRHEIGHYYWDRLVRDGEKLELCRRVFGDDRLDYEQALQAHYANGAPADWQANFVSSYATTHPWEDFAETWAHYLHIVDTLEMAGAFGMHIHPDLSRNRDLDAKVEFDPYRAQDARQLINTWIPMSNALNNLNRAMGQQDIYPFVLSPPVIEKLGVIHQLIHGDGNVHVDKTATPTASVQQ
jgi:hypothetical protein